MELERALEAAIRLRDAIASEIAGARGARQLLRTLDSDGLFARAAQRAAFLADVASLERSLAAALARAAGVLGIPEVTLDRLRALASVPAARLADVLSEARAMAGALQEIDRLNLELARRAMAVVRGYVEAVRPTPRTYDRFGARTTTPALALVSSQG